MFGQTTTLPEQVLLADLLHNLVDNVDARLAQTQQGQPPPHLVVAAQQQPAVETGRGVRPPRAHLTRRRVHADAVCIGDDPRHPVPPNPPTRASPSNRIPRCAASFSATSVNSRRPSPRR